MKRNLLLLMVITLIPLMKLSAQCASSANIYSFTMNGKSYEIVKEMKSWTDAAACALQRGGHLIYINSKLEQDSIYKRITQGAGISPSYTSVGDGGGASYLWIGATDKVTEGAWIWDGTNSGTGTAFWNGQGAAGTGGGSAVGTSFIYWGGAYNGVSNEPDNYANIQDGAAIALTEWPLGTTGTNRLGAPSEWNDISLTNQIYYIIEFETSGINEQKSTNKIELFPNPVQDNLTINTNTSSKLTLTIYDELGRIVLNEMQIVNHSNINIAKLNKGIYYYILTDNINLNFNGKFVKQ